MKISKSGLANKAFISLQTSGPGSDEPTEGWFLAAELDLTTRPGVTPDLSAPPNFEVPQNY